jgi:hypothetical protein
MEAITASERDQLTAIHHRSQSFECHPTTADCLGPLAPSIAEFVAARTLPANHLDCPHCCVEGLGEPLLSRTESERADVRVESGQPSVLIDGQRCAAPVEHEPISDPGVGRVGVYAVPAGACRRPGRGCRWPRCIGSNRRVEDNGLLFEAKPLRPLPATLAPANHESSAVGVVVDAHRAPGWGTGGEHGCSPVAIGRCREKLPPSKRSRSRTTKAPRTRGFQKVRRRGLEPPPGYPGPGPQPCNPGVRSVQCVLCIHIVQSVRVSGRNGRTGPSGCCHGCCRRLRASRSEDGGAPSRRRTSDAAFRLSDRRAGRCHPADIVGVVRHPAWLQAGEGSSAA